MSLQKENHSRSGSVATSALFAILLLIASAASAGSDTTKPFTGNTSNPCNGDSVTYTGSEHQVNNNHVNPDGTVFTNFMDQMTGNGPGTPSGIQYNVGLTGKVNGKFPPGPVIFRSRTKVNSTGPAQNFFETFFFRINQDGTPGNTSFESDCRG
jgi:hypothetical protein